MAAQPELRQRKVNTEDKERRQSVQEQATELLETAKTYVPDLDKEKAEISRFQKLISASSSSAPPALVPYIKKCEPVLAVTIWFFLQNHPNLRSTVRRGRKI